jgi:hypothetical protein
VSLTAVLAGCGGSAATNSRATSAAVKGSTTFAASTNAATGPDGQGVVAGAPFVAAAALVQLATNRERPLNKCHGPSRDIAGVRCDEARDALVADAIAGLRSGERSQESCAASRWGR